MENETKVIQMNPELQVDGGPDFATKLEIEPNQIKESPEDIRTKFYDKEPLKEPIFIGGNLEPELLNKFNELVPEGFEIAVLNPEVQKSCRETYFFYKMGEKEREAAINMRNDQHSFAQALQTAYEIEKMFLEDMGKKTEDVEMGKQAISFNYLDLKNLIKKYRDRNFSNKQNKEAIEYLCLFGLFTALKPNTPYVRQEWAITISYEHRLRALQNCITSIKEDIEKATGLIEAYEKEIVFVNKQYGHEKTEEVVEEKIPLTNKQQKIYDLLKETPELAPEKICEQLDCESISTELKQMIDLGVLFKVSRGKYKVV